jgi:hypothetical protein
MPDSVACELGELSVLTAQVSVEPLLDEQEDGEHEPVEARDAVLAAAEAEPDAGDDSVVVVDTVEGEPIATGRTGEGRPSGRTISDR